MNILDGYKTKIAGVTALCGAIYFASIKDWQQAYTLFLSAMTVFGLGGKLQKLIDAAKDGSGT